MQKRTVCDLVDCFVQNHCPYHSPFFSTMLYVWDVFCVYTCIQSVLVTVKQTQYIFSLYNLPTSELSICLVTQLYQCDKFLSTNLVRFAEWGVSAPSQSWMTNDPAILSSGSLGAYRHHQRVIDSSCLSSTIHIAIICNTFCFHNIYIYILLKLTNFCKFLFFFAFC